jgi:hypothetical protein
METKLNVDVGGPMKISLDKLDLICYTIKELEIMMTTDKTVRREVLLEIKRRVKPGAAVTKRTWKEAYDHVRQIAIDETILWKHRFITIE